MKRILALILAAFFCLSLCACSREGDIDSTADAPAQAPADAPEGPKEEDYHNVKAKIMIIGKNSTDPFTNWLLTAAEKVIKEDYPNVEYVVTNLNDDPSNIVTLLDQCVLDGYDGVLIQKGSNSINSDEWYQNAAAEGLKITAINAIAKDGVASCSYADDYGMAQMMAEHMAGLLPENAKVVFFKGPDGNQAAMDRVDAYQEHLFKARPDITIIAENFVEGWKKENAITLMEDWCQKYDEIDGIISVNDTMALAGLDVMKNAGRDISSVYSCGIDGLADGCLSIEAGGLTASILQNADVMSEEGVRLLMQMINGDMNHASYIVDGVLITPDNVSEMIRMHRDNGIIK